MNAHHRLPEALRYVVGVVAFAAAIYALSIWGPSFGIVGAGAALFLIAVGCIPWARHFGVAGQKHPTAGF